MSELFQWSATILTITSVLYYGVPNSSSLKGPIFGLMSQVPWWGLMVVEELWGLAIMNAFMLVSHIINLYRRAKY